MIRNWSRIALLNFFFAACLGALMRFAFVEEVSWMNFRHVLHGHSHVAMLGWLYMALYALLIHSFLTKEQQENRYYNRLFWLSQISVVGMFISFPIQGYGGISITFSTLHVLCSYAFIWQFSRDLRTQKLVYNQSHSLLRLSLLFQLISSLGLWAMGPVMALGFRSSQWYYMAVQFYLHFQFNGWYLFAALALFFQYIGLKGIQFYPPLLKKFRYSLTIATLLTFSLALTWANPEWYLFGINGLGALVQLIALCFLFLLLHRERVALRNWYSQHKPALWLVAFVCFFLKILVQSAVIIPYVAQIGYTIRNFVIGFLHLLLLGIISHFVLGYAEQQKILQFQNGWGSWGIRLFFAGFVISEVLLFSQGLLFWAAWGFIPFYYELLFGGSLLIPLGIMSLNLAQLRH